MTSFNNGHRADARRLLTLAAVALCGLAGLAAGQSQTIRQPDPSSALKVGILPFADATASGNRAAGTDVGRTMLSEMVHSTNLQPRMLASDKADALDAEKAIALGKEQHVDLVFMGTVLEAKAEESNKSGWIPSIKGQSGNLTVRRMKATVTLQGELYNVATGQRLFSERVTVNNSNNALGGTAYTTFGAWGNDSYRNFLDSPLGKALQSAIAEMTKKVAAARPAPRG
ncbi:MAG: hypothetical protein JWL71_1892 [Acidobacteria bacterium]|nr:hypothetical protein [Acidobacteriota bacterium]